MFCNVKTPGYYPFDGNIVEWLQEKFTVDKATKIRYAVDNDSQMLFLALNIPDKRHNR
jgi:hypothetical protein